MKGTTVIMQYSDDISTRMTARHMQCIRLCADTKSKKLLNIGCYNGWFEKAQIESGCKEIVGIDVNEKFLRLSKKNVNEAKFIKSSVCKLPFRSNYFDLVAMFDVLEHINIEKIESVLAEIKRVLKKDGKVIISVPNAAFLSISLDPAWYFGHRHYSEGPIKKKLINAGFRIEEIKYGGGFYEIFSMILLYVFKWLLKCEIPFKSFFDSKRNIEYFGNKGFVTLFVKASVCPPFVKVTN